MSHDPLQVTKETIMFTAEASDFGWPVGKFMPSFVYMGAEFIHVKTERDDNDDVQAWVYWSNSIHKHAKIFND